MKLKIFAYLLLISVMAAATAWGSDTPRMTTDELKGRLGEAGLVVVDVRATGDWKSSDKMIKSAWRGNPNDIGEWTGKLKMEQTIVLYCS